MKKTRVLIYGDSILLDGTRTALEKIPGIEVLSFSADVNINDLLKVTNNGHLRYDVLFIDITDGHPGFFMDTFLKYPEISVVGLIKSEPVATIIHRHDLPVAKPKELERLVNFCVSNSQNSTLHVLQDASHSEKS